ncbi:MAG: class I SAM-dependent methyltransferase [Polyangiaceae bacterium]|nr:class I SAM-dependent methyltransferase [Polyangiaceae bacterium]
MSEAERRVASHYNIYPYPTVVQLARPRVSGFARGTLSYLLRRREHNALPKNARVWVAGCGTQQGVHWGLTWPEASIVATDVSEKQLETAALLSSQLKVTNTQFVQQSILDADYREEFDFVVCTGVLHHTPDPDLGLQKLRQALKPNGALLLMMYSRVHREPLQRFRDVVNSIEPPSGDPEKRYEIACDLLGSMLDSEQCSPPYKSVFEQLWEVREADRGFFADAILHPLDASYDVNELLAYLARGGLKHSSWLHPHQWNPSTYLGEHAICEKLKKLSPEAQWNAVYTLAGYTSPLLEVLCERADAPESLPYAENELLEMPVICDRGATAFKVEKHAVVASAEVPAYTKRNGMLSGKGRGGFGARYKWQLPEEAEPVLLACDGKTKLGGIVERFEGELGREGLLTMFDTLLPQDIGFIAPVWT